MLAGFVALVATIVKRLHDRDESGWWSLVYFIPVVCLWVFIKCGFLKGTPGPNRFGPDPLAPPEQSYNSAPAAIVSTETVQTPVTP